jgi:hypothetical protein
VKLLPRYVELKCELEFQLLSFRDEKSLEFLANFRES